MNLKQPLLRNLILTAGVFLLIVACKEKPSPTLFTVVQESESGLHFNNRLIENDSINIIDNEFVYNGAGVALGDVNGDGLEDIFLAGNQVENKLFINRGKLTFEDVSETARIQKNDSLMWSSGVSIVDINADGKLDIYVCNTFRKDTEQRANLLYINQGNNEEGLPEFLEMGEMYGLADSSYSSHAQFFDFDRDGDLDVFIGVNRIDDIDPGEFRPLNDDGSSPSRDRLYENTFNDSLGQQQFVDVSKKAGIRYHGYSHSTVIHDFNEDGWLDIYVANDFLSNDLIYLNNQDGTFTNKAGTMFKHFSLSSMGSDIADVDNNGRMDVYTTEMQPYYNKRKKLFQGPSNYQKEVFTKRFGYEFQYARNTLQVNMGTNPETGLPIYSEVGMYAGIQETDWSWAPLFADYDNDGWQDLLVTNGFPKDVTDRDFGDFRITAKRLLSKEKLIAAIPEIKIPNFIFKNKGELAFEDATKAWGLNFGTYSSGAAYGDLDNDGDLDLVISNINDPVLLMQNHAETLHPQEHHLRIKLQGEAKNKSALGASVEIFAGDLIQKKALLSGRGYLSQPEQTLHFGLGTINEIDSIKISWPNGTIQDVLNNDIDTTITIAYNPNDTLRIKKNDALQQGIFEEVASKYQLNHFIGDHDFIDFNFQTTLPHKFSQFGPSVSVGDVNNDGLDDMLVAGSRSFDETWFLQTSEGIFERKEASFKTGRKLEEDAGTLLFDADNDGDLDLYVARGCGQYPAGAEQYTDVLYENDGIGNFSPTTNALPLIATNSSAVKAADFDQDGDLDLFVGSRVLSFSYPLSDRSFILRNDSANGVMKFVDVTEAISKELVFAGLVSDALWTDFNGDSWPDLILATEWMPLRFFENTKGGLQEITQSTGINEYSGWWNSLSPADLDNDGDMDYIAGNFGMNSYYRGTKEQPVRIYAKDLDQNGSIDPLISYYLRDSIGTKREYMYHPWQDVTKQFVGIRKKFNSFGEFGAMTMPEIFPDGLMDDATILTYNHMKSGWVENLGSGKFKLHAFPMEAQLAPVYGTFPIDIDNDQQLDLLLVGNDFGMEVQQGKADAFNGLLLKNNGNRTFTTSELEDSHFFVPGNGKSLASVRLANGNSLIIATQNNDSLRVFEPTIQTAKSVRLALHEVKALIEYKNGSKNLREYYWGSGFQSQSSRTLSISEKINNIRFFNGKGEETRNITTESL